MGNLSKITAVFVFLFVLLAHLILLVLFLAPSPILFRMAFGAPYQAISAEEIPAEVRNFISQNNIEISYDFDLQGSAQTKLAAGILELRTRKIESADEFLAIKFNLLDFGEGIIGLESASQYYYKKPLSELTDAQWITLVNLQKIFSK